MDFLDTPEKKERRLIHVPMGRFGEACEQAKGALFRSCPLSFPLLPPPPFSPLLCFLPDMTQFKKKKTAPTDVD